MERELRRIVFTGPEQAVVETVPFNLSLEPDMVLLRTRWTLLSPGTELAVYTDRHNIGHRNGTHFPAYPGYAAMGVIETVGSMIKNLSPGDRVLAVTGHCSLAKFKPAQTFCLPLPDDIRDDHAPFIRMALISLATLCQADIQAGEWLGVVGLGLVGNLGAQIGLHAGLKVIGVGRSALRTNVAARCGIHPILSGEASAIEDRANQITEGRRCRLVLDTSGTADGLLKAIALAVDGGSISLVGVPWESDPTVAATAIMQPVFSRYLTIHGGWEWGLPLYARDYDAPLPMLPHRHSVEQNARHALGLIRSGRVQVEPLITHRIAPRMIQEAYQGLLRQRNDYLGVLINWDDDC